MILTIIANLNNWCFYYLKILENKNAGEKKMGIGGNKYKKIIRFVNCLAYVYAAVFLVLYIYFLCKMIEQNNSMIDECKSVFDT